MSGTLPPGPWRIEPIPHRKDLRVVAPNGSLLAEVTGPDKAAVAALLVRAREVEAAAREWKQAVEEEENASADEQYFAAEAVEMAAERLRSALGGGG